MITLQVVATNCYLQESLITLDCFMLGTTHQETLATVLTLLAHQSLIIDINSVKTASVLILLNTLTSTKWHDPKDVTSLTLVVPRPLVVCNRKRNQCLGRSVDMPRKLNLVATAVNHEETLLRWKEFRCTALTNGCAFAFPRLL